MPFLEQMEDILVTVVTFMVHIIEIMGAAIIIWGALKSFFDMFSTHGIDVRLQLAQFMALGLEFKLGGEILRTVIVRDLSEIALVGAIIALRSLLNFLIHWEIKHIKHGNNDDSPSFELALLGKFKKKGDQQGKAAKAE